MASKETIVNTAFSWTGQKGLLIVGLFLAVAFVSEFFIVSFFMGSGLTEATQLPVSPLFHILPIVVIVVLVLSWTYLTKHVAVKPYRKATTKVPKSRRYARRRARKSNTSIIETIKNVLEIGRAHV